MESEQQQTVSSDLKEQIIELPSTLLKISRKMVSLNDRIVQNKKEANEIYNDMKELEKLLERYMAGCVKKIKKDNEPKQRKPTGFAAPSPVSEHLCAFLGIEKGEFVSRTYVSKYLAKYISDNSLRDPEHKNQIVPDAKLKALLGEECESQIITYFNIQKYMNKHFIKANALPAVIAANDA